MVCNHIKTDLSPKRTKFQIGDRVQRLVDVYDEKSRLMHGSIVRVYKMTGCRFGPYPEMYDVRWDEIKDRFRGEGFLPHGLDPEMRK